MVISKNHSLAFFALISFSILAVSCVQQNHIHYGAFNYNNRVEDELTKSFIIKQDGTKVYGKNASWSKGLFKSHVYLDGVKYLSEEVKGFQKNGTYYGRMDRDYFKRIIHGKINIYVFIDEQNVLETDDHGFHSTHHYSNTKHYAQRGEDGPMIYLANRDVMFDLVKDCPLSVSMLGPKGYKQLRKGRRHDINYANRIFEIYNNDCKEDSSK